MDCSTPGLPVHHQLPELAQTHVHRVSDAVQPSHPLLSPFPLVAHWLGLHTPSGGAQVQSLVRELDPTCHSEDLAQLNK